MCKLVWCAEPKAEPFCACNNGNYKTWDEVRFNVEEQNGMIESPSKRNKRANVCIIGYFKDEYESHKKLKTPLFALDPSVNVVECDQVIMLHRIPLQVIHNRHVPRRIAESRADYEYTNKIAKSLKEQMQRMRQTSDENKRLSIVQEITRLKYLEPFPTIRKYPHPSDAIMKQHCDGYVTATGNRILWEDVAPAKIDPYYCCANCANYFTKLHHEVDCPSNAIEDWIPMKDRPVPLGIPKSELRRVSWSENESDIKNAKYIDVNGTLWDPV